jgi:hypothetical protein
MAYTVDSDVGSHLGRVNRGMKEERDGRLASGEE